MAGVNRVFIIGNLGNDPEMRYMPNGEPVANLSIATSETWNDKNTGEKREKTEWHRVVAYRRNHRPVHAQGQQTLRRGQVTDAQMDGQQRRGQIHHRNHRRQRATTRQPPRRPRRIPTAGLSTTAPAAAPAPAGRQPAAAEPRAAATTRLG